MDATPQLPFKPYDVFAHAEAFEAGAKILNEQVHRTRHVGLIAPMVACRVFAVELYLKAVLRCEGVAILFKHELDVLFTLVPAHIQGDIIARYDQLLPEYDAEITGLQRVIQAMGGVAFATDFSGALSEAAKDFQKHRYLFETMDEGPGSNVTILCILRAVRGYLLAVERQWETGYPALLSNLVRRLPSDLPVTGTRPVAPENTLLGALHFWIGCANAPCPHIFDLIFEFAPGAGALLQQQQPAFLLYPASQMAQCPVCHAHNDLRPACEGVERDLGKPIYFAAS